MSSRRIVAALGLLLASTVGPAAAQQSADAADSVRVQLRSTLRAFYFSLAHRDWQTLSAYVLPAKVVAHHPAPEAIVRASTRTAGATGEPGAVRLAGSAPASEHPACSGGPSISVEDAVITLRDDWAEASVARCGAMVAETDEFRFIHFEGRWWIVFIDLAQQPDVMQVAR